MKENLKLGGILLAITAIAGLILAFAYDITRAPIEAKAKEDQAAAMKVVLEAEEFSELKDGIADENVTGIFQAKTSGSDAGYVFQVNSSGYGGKIELMVGIDAEGAVSGITILSHTETPGLGSKAKDDPSFAAQYKGLSSEKELTVGSDIQAITGATITSKAVTTGVNTAINYYNTNLKGAK
ncbi:electron transporter RnfG [Clostridium sulfidigenes]|uniref:Ion-translocating oxidoreductase complex subunit G n=1 Tax=Clostridium sulfidigenes TaxID=318464 RepID=A0A084JAD3_9CLOT|nr:RnfABCDGE type electron transport complex subunit G [Clostridium sulfidigenes]KEZ85917.1 electron transporter RnfG [Clostridium sulfidigenes]HAR85670.1 RnfABCDGE type electron transport complex subunit G [Clostridium sp.]